MPAMRGCPDLRRRRWRRDRKSTPGRFFSICVSSGSCLRRSSSLVVIVGRCSGLRLQLFQNLENLAIGFRRLVLGLFLARIADQRAQMLCVQFRMLLPAVASAPCRPSAAFRGCAQCACNAAVSDLDAPLQLSSICWMAAISSSSSVRIFLPTYCVWRRRPS